MVSKVKSKDIVIHQTEAFLDYYESVGNITNQVKNDIIDILRGDDFDIYDRSEIKSKLSGIVSEDEFDELYSDYVEYNKHAFFEFKKIFDDLKLFPEGYEFLSKDFAIFCVKGGENLDELKRNLTPEEVENFRINLLNNINILKGNLGISNSDLKKFFNFLVSEVDESVVVDNIKLFINAGINSADDFPKLQEILNYNYSEVLEIFINAGINSADDFVKLDEVNLIKLQYTNTLELFINSGISNVDDLVKLHDVIIDSSHYPDISCEKLLKVFLDAGIKSADDFVKLKDFFRKPYYLPNVELFCSVGIKSADEFLKLSDIIFKQRLLDGQRENLKVLYNGGINSADDFVKLSNIIFYGNYKYLQFFMNIGIKTSDDLLKIKDLICLSDGYLENLLVLGNVGINKPKDFLELKNIIFRSSDKNLQLFADAGIKKASDFLKLEDLILFGYSDNIKILVDAGIKKADNFLLLKDFIVLNSDVVSKSCNENLKIFAGAGIKKASDFLKLKNFIFKGYSNILKLFVDAGMKEVDDFLKIEDEMDYGYPENVKYNLETFKEIGIEKIVDLLKLKKCIFANYKAVSRKIELLKLANISAVDDIVRLGGFISGEEFTDLLYQLRGISEKTGVVFSESLYELSNFVAGIWDEYGYGYSYEVQKNLLYLFYDKGFSLTDIKNFSSLLISNPDVLLCVFNMFKDISLSELERLEYILRFSSVDCLTQIFKQYPDITFDELIELEDVLKVNESNLKIILEKYPEISQQGLLNLVDFLDRVNNDNLKIIFKKYPDIDITTILGLTAILSTAYPKSFENILDCFEIYSTDLQKYRYLLLFNGKIPEFVNLKEADRSGYLKYLNEVASTSYDDDKKSLMMQKILSLSFDEAENYLKIFKMFDDSISMDVQRIKNELIDEILKSEKPEMIANAINDIFERNNLPLTGKIFKVFELLYPKEKFKSTLQSHGSPVLHQYLDEGKNVYSLIYKDLMNIAIDSGDRSLKNYLNTFIGCEAVLKKFENIVNDPGFDSGSKSCLEGKLDEREQEQLLFLFRKCSVLYNRYFGKDIEEGDLIYDNALGMLNISGDQLVRFYNNISDSFRLKKGESMYDRLNRFLWGLGYHSFDEVLDRMNESKKNAHERGLKLFNQSNGGIINFPDHAFLKGVDEKAFSHLINRGITCREYLGGGENGDAAGSDGTPFDADGWYTDSFIEGGYGSVKLVVNTDKESIYDSREKGVEGYKSGKYELFKTGYLGENHYGIRTGIPTTEVDYLIYTGSFESEKFKKMCYEIVRNGYYIPITDNIGNIKFTPEMYHKIRAGFNFMEYYDGFDVELKDGKYVSCESDNGVNRFYNGTNEKINNEELGKLIEENSPSNDKYKSFAKKNGELARSTIERIKRILEEKCGVKFNSEYDSSITGAEIHDSGSTGRGTDIPTKDVDLDFTLLLDAKDYERVNEISKIIHKEIGTQKNDDHGVVEGGNQIKSKINNIGKSDERPNGVPLDLLILKKSQVIDYSSSDAMKEKLEYIKHNLGEKDFERVKTNVMIMKKLLKAKGCYKKPEGGISGIGVENWITQHHGSFIEALESFEQIAYGGEYAPGKNPISLEEFKEQYPIYDAGENYKDGGNDNFVNKIDKDKESNNTHCYESMLDIIKALRTEGIEGIRKIISDYENLKKDYIS